MTDTNSLITSQIAAAAACSYIINLLQDWKALPWITEHTKLVNIALRAVLSGAATLGITTAWSAGTADSHVLTILIPSMPDLVHAAWHWFSQYALTHLAGSALEKPKQLNPVTLDAPVGGQ